MTRCPRCGTSLLPKATVCTACCHQLDESGADRVLALIGAPADREAAVEVATASATASGGTPDRGNDSLLHWPFGGADDDTAAEVAQSQAVETRAMLAQAADVASAGKGNGVRIPNQRGVAFHPVQVATQPPPNRYLDAERRQQAGFRAEAPRETSTPPEGPSST